MALQHIPKLQKNPHHKDKEGYSHLNRTTDNLLPEDITQFGGGSGGGGRRARGYDPNRDGSHECTIDGPAAQPLVRLLLGCCSQLLLLLLL